MQTILLYCLPPVMGYKDLLTFVRSMALSGIYNLILLIKCLGVYFLCNAVLTDITDSVGKFYGKFNNIMAVLSKHSNEMSTLHLVKSYCLPALLYGCEVWHLNDSNRHKISVAWNNCFRGIFSCCWRESVKPLQYFWHTLPIPYLLHQRKLLFWKKSCIALILLFYSHYLVACIRLVLLWVVCIMCCRRNCQTTQSEN